MRDAWDRDYYVVVLSDCCTARTAEEHQYALTKIFPSRSLVATYEEAAKVIKG